MNEPQVLFVRPFEGSIDVVLEPVGEAVPPGFAEVEKDTITDTNTGAHNDAKAVRVEPTSGERGNDAIVGYACCCADTADGRDEKTE